MLKIVEIWRNYFVEKNYYVFIIITELAINGKIILGNADATKKRFMSAKKLCRNLVTYRWANNPAKFSKCQWWCDLASRTSVQIRVKVA